MTKAAFTPGPWGVEELHDTLWVGRLRSSGTGFDDAILSMENDRDYKPEVRERRLADAHLIAASPELYEALEAIMSAHASRVLFHNTALAEKAYAALAKARGEQL